MANLIRFFQDTMLDILINFPPHLAVSFITKDYCMYQSAVGSCLSSVQEIVITSFSFHSDSQLNLMAIPIYPFRAHLQSHILNKIVRLLKHIYGSLVLYYQINQIVYHIWFKAYL